MAEERFKIALEDCISRLADGESVTDCLRHYPEFAADLAIMLETGLIVQRVQASDTEVAQSQARVAKRFEAALSTPVTRRRTNRRWWRGIVLAAALFILLIFVNVALAQGSIPSDWNYGLKRFSESVILIFSSNDEQFAARRFEEIETLLTLQREAEIDFEGEVLIVNATGFLVRGLANEIEASSEILAGLRPNQAVRILANSRPDGRLIARQVQIVDNLGVEPDIIISPSPTMTLTATATYTASLEISPSLAVTIAPTSEANQAPCVVSVPNGWIAYVIQSGDSLFNLAIRSGISLETITRVNCIEDPSLISVGQTVYLPVPAQNNEAPEQASPETVPTQGSRPNEGTPVATRQPVRPSPTPTLGR